MPIPLYVQYEESFRGFHIRVVIQGEWKAKTKAQKNAWKKAYLAIRKQERAVETQDDVVDRFENDLEQGITNGALNISDKATHARFVARVEAVRNQYRRLANEHVGVSQLYLDLGKLEQKQNLIQTSDKHATDESEAALAQARWAADQAQHRMDLIEGNPPVILDPNGHRRMPGAWLTDRRAPLRHRHLVESDVGAGRFGVDLGGQGQWVPQQVLGGALSLGYVWLRVDALGAVQDRLVRKDTHLPESGWLDPRYWDGEVLDFNNRLPKEAVITRDMMAVQNLVHTVRLRVIPTPAHADNVTFTYRLYLEFAPQGDLGALLDEHIEIDAPMPETFVWYVFEALAKAGLAMKQGDMGTPRDGWKEIVHRDLKSANVFLDLPQVNHYPLHPKPIMGDYGIAIKTSENDPLNPLFYRNFGPKGYTPPEQLDTVDRRNLTTLDNFRLDEATNVYGVGLTLWSLVENKNEPPTPAFLGNPTLDRELAIEDKYGLFTHELKDLIALCLNYRPADRPTFEFLLAAIEDATGGVPDLSKGMRDGTAIPVLGIPRFGSELYALGFVAPDPIL